MSRVRTYHALSAPILQTGVRPLEHSLRFVLHPARDLNSQPLRLERSALPIELARYIRTTSKTPRNRTVKPVVQAATYAEVLQHPLASFC